MRIDFTGRLVDEAVEYNDQPLPPGLVVMTLPASPYRHAGSPDREVYSQGDSNSADYYSEVWLPIVEK